jgi:hypothetical protein
MFQKLFLGFVLLLTSSVAASAEDYSALFTEAIDNIEWELEKEWAFTESSLKEGELWVGRHDPRLDQDERWTLVSIDGREPTSKEARKYAHDKREHDSSEDSRTTKIVKSDSLELIEETDDFWLFTFVPDDDETEFIDSVDAKIRIIKSGRYVESIDMRNHSAIEPGWGTRLSQFLMRLEFGPAAEDGPIVPLSTKVHVTGRALLFISIDETEVTNFSDFEHVVE